MIDVLVPAGVGDWKATADRLGSMPCLRPFDPAAVDFVAAVSSELLRSDTVRRFPEMIAAGHWMRKAHLLEIKKQWESRQVEELRLARGMALHFAPANVDSIFLYSWLLSLLAGNPNVVRISRRRGEQIMIVLGTLASVLEREPFLAIRERTLILSYDHDDSVTAHLSAHCQIRVLWGGDESVRHIRGVPLNPLAVELPFADRYAVAILDADKVAGLSEEKHTRLVSDFFNDCFWFDQLACSSPREVIWIGSASSCERAKTRFWPALQAFVEKKQAPYAEVVGINKLNALYQAAALGSIDAISSTPTGPTSNVARGHLSGMNDAYREVHCGGGIFFEQEMSDFADAASTMKAKDQTVCQFDFSKEDVAKFVERLPQRAVDRIVPVGSALQFDTTWDGVDLLDAFTRRVSVR
jgi:hypothetical protein